MQKKLYYASCVYMCVYKANMMKLTKQNITLLNSQNTNNHINPVGKKLYFKLKVKKEKKRRS